MVGVLSNDDRSSAGPAMTEERVPERQAETIPPGEEVLGQFLGDEAFPVTWASEVERQLFWVYDDLHIPLPVYGEHFADWWRDRLRPEMERNFAYLEDRLDAADSLSLAELATVLEDAIDIHDRHWKIHWMLNFAQLSATLNLRAVMERMRGSIDEALLGRLQNSASDRNWDSIEALWRMKNEVRDEPGLRAAV